jgi:hypothetical protein
MNARRTAPAVLATLALAVTLAACGATPGTVGDNASPSQAAQPDKALETPSAEPAAEDKPAGPAILAWAETLTYEDGLAISVSQPTGYAPSEWAAGTDGFASFVVLNVTVTNGTAVAYSPASLRIAATSGGAAAGSVFDSAMDGQGADLGMSPNADILPGQSVTWAVGYGVANTADLTVDVSGGYDEDFNEYQHGYWQGAAA